MDRFFVNPENIDLENKKLKISGEDVKHITKVLRLGIGDTVEVCDSNNSEYICEIDSIEKEYIDLDIVDKVEINRESNIRVKLYQGLPKSTKMEIILQKLTECGVSEIVLVNTKRTVVSLDNKNIDKKLQRWERIIYESSKQSKRGQIPKLVGVLDFKEALEDMKNNDFNISAYESEQVTGIKEVLRSDKVVDLIKQKKEITIGIFIGPEGGFTEQENKQIIDEGISSVSLGPRILRTETASIVASAIVLYELGDIGGRTD
ncbi:16S rRNA (uracil(1498)-N(3))-methyltransferase [Peptostreptococcus faecalis]|uniref:16S rRNA (uracil(1498)-N(3))-methyltransferase n=1 Tax=Peptostreptococcus faecalis TaxID=2045015 RepID=UPI000C796F30|nr:16S rRNA (uracil(1498)-N(3))-methyltransferase [Peptostreptococcus faecalis]